MQRRWFMVLTLAGMLVVVAACGRVDLEDLTPEAVKTEQAEAAIAATQTSEAQPDIPGDPDRGLTIFQSFCFGCHIEQNVPSPELLGNVYLLDDYMAMFREGTGPNGESHITYASFELSDENLQDVLAFIATNTEISQ